MVQTPERSIFDILATTLPAPSKRDAILAAASLVFIGQGYEGASMELVAQKAGAVRRTVYNQFPEGKKQLFHAVAERMWRSFPVMDIATDEQALGDPAEGLRRIGYGIASFWDPPLAIEFLRMTIGESSRFPELMQSFFEVGKTPAVRAVTEYITTLGDRGALTIDDPDLAARHFLGLVDETVLWMRVMGSSASLTTSEIERVVERAVSIFLGHYQAKPT
ncbi:TetR/AcrR family transcriptional regulator [Sphingomonas abietis]|uniref:TetR/AcrR family transcriptional regulator n=1 Tax=Sphingomonas abietis TaxID=3012344 RepID=A0ABY7NGT0_9SPHN|nr:TetR/AcrR family transcriptional regulator [Sphingomonas abietis]WBO20756.1 TetR/AcrR family transcriptional regulator [Sphingomonas abietis]